jgi:uncharacterized membrane protein YfcA
MDEISTRLVLISGMCWRQFMFPSGLEPEAWKYLAVVVPVVTVFGPVGALLSSYCHRQVLASFIYILDTLALVSIILSYFGIQD